jgi:hypothetical protein
MCKYGATEIKYLYLYRISRENATVFRRAAKWNALHRRASLCIITVSSLTGLCSVVSRVIQHKGPNYETCHSHTVITTLQGLMFNVSDFVRPSWEGKISSLSAKRRTKQTQTAPDMSSHHFEAFKKEFSRYNSFRTYKLMLGPTCNSICVIPLC